MVIIMGIYERLKRLMQKLFPSYRVSLRLEDKLNHELFNQKTVESRLEAQIRAAENCMLTQIRATENCLVAQVSPMGYRIEAQIKALENRMETMFWLLNAKPGEMMEQTKQRVFMDMPAWNVDIAMIQKGSGYLLRRMRQICQERDIPFWLLGGTLLGAVRHKGFIPWDDDIDVGMMWDDVERFREAVKEYPDLRLDWRFWNSMEHTASCHALMLTLADDRAPFSVDVMLYDYAGDPSKDEKEIWQEITQCRSPIEKELAELRSRMKRMYGGDCIDDDEDRRLVEEVYRKARASLPPVVNRDYIYRSIDSVCGPWQRLFPCERIMPFTQLEFEGELYNVPKDYEWQLGLQYGDYMTIPGDVGVARHFFLRKRLEYAELSLKELGLE